MPEFFLLDLAQSFLSFSTKISEKFLSKSPNRGMFNTLLNTVFLTAYYILLKSFFHPLVLQLIYILAI